MAQQRSLFWRREHRSHGRRSSDNEPRPWNLPRNPSAAVHDTVEKAVCWLRNEAAQSVFIAEDVKPAVIDFFFAEPRRLKNPNH